MRFYQTIKKKRGSRFLVLLLPGYTGGSGAFSSLIPLFTSDIISITYPGHGEDYKNFPSTNSEDWEQSVIRVIKEESEHYDDILIVGYSMGGSLALLYGKDYPKILLAPAVIGKANSPRDDQNKKPITLDAVNPKLKAMCDAEDIEALQWFLRTDSQKSQIELNKIETKANNLTRIDFDNTYAFIGEKDPVIPYSKANPWLTEHNIKVKSFKESTHAILYDDNATKVIDDIKGVLFSNKEFENFIS